MLVLQNYLFKYESIWNSVAEKIHHAFYEVYANFSVSFLFINHI